MTRAAKDAAHLDGVLAAWQAAFADAEGENMPGLYSAASDRARHDDWTRLRPLLLALRTMLRINNTLTIHMASGLRQSIEPTADAETADELWAVHEHLSAALNPLNAVLAATRPDTDVGDGDGPGLGRPRRPVRVHDAADGRLRDLWAIPVVGAGTAVVSVGVGLAAAAQQSAVWWRGFRRRHGRRTPPTPR